MATISGVMAYDPTNLYSFPNPTPAGRIVSVPIVLQDINTNVGLIVLSSGIGDFTFTNVPVGTYRLVEAWGVPGVTSPTGDFSAAVVIPPPTSQDPPITQAPAPPPGATRLQSLTRNTIVPITIASPLDVITGQDFVDAPIVETPLITALREATIVGSNLVIDAQDGEWGTLPDGAANQSIAPVEPFPGVVPSEIYDPIPSNVGANAQRYNATNIAYSQSYNNLWYSMTNHTTFDETSRMMVINAAGGGPLSNERIFQTTISVAANTFYIGFSWIANLFNNDTGVTPQIGVVVRDVGNNIIFTSPTPQLIFSNPPEWVQTGGVFNTGNNTTVVVQYLSISTGDFGNDFAADDFSIFQVQLNNFLRSGKTVNKPIANIGDILNYTVTIANPGSTTNPNSTTANSVFFQDTIPAGTTFVPSSVIVNSTPQPGFNPQTGFTIGDLGIGLTSTITFNVTVVSLPANKQAINNSTTNYNFAPVEGGVTVPFTIFSNSVSTNIVAPSISKTVNKLFTDRNSTVHYTIVYTNNSLITATNVVFIDTIPLGSSFVPNSLLIDNVPNPGNPNPPGVLLPSPIGPGVTTTITFDVAIGNTITNNPLVNNATIQAVYNDSSGNTISNSASSNTTTTTISFANLTSSKAVNKTFADVRDILVYTIPITNSGTTTAFNIVFIDTIPNDTTLVPGSFTQNGVALGGSPNPPGVSLNNIGPNATTTIVFNVLINTIPNPNPINNSAFTVYSYTIDSATLPIITANSLTNTNIVSTQVNTASISTTSKSVSTSFATCGDTLTYTATLSNSGNVTATNVTFIDTIPNGTSFVNNSVTVGGVTQIGANPQVGVLIGTIVPSQSVTVTFKVIVNC